MRVLQHICLIAGLVCTLGTSALYAGYVATTEAEIQAIADPMLDDILVGMQNNDLERFSRNFGIKMRRCANSQTMNEWYESMLGNHGSYLSREYLGSVNQSKHTLVLWKGKFSKAEDDILLMLYLSKIEGANVVIGFYYYSDMWPSN